MKQSPTWAEALERFFHDRCPLCGRGRGKERGKQGVEKRKKQGDLYCHACRRPWAYESLQALKQELLDNQDPQGASPSSRPSLLSRIKELVPR